jgi:hypothetical protein
MSGSEKVVALNSGAATHEAFIEENSQADEWYSDDPLVKCLEEYAQAYEWYADDPLVKWLEEICQAYEWYADDPLVKWFFIDNKAIAADVLFRYSPSIRKGECGLNSLEIRRQFKRSKKVEKRPKNLK